MKKITLIILAITVFVTLSGCKNNPSLDEFAECITEKGATLYGTYWCGNCKKQKELFGDSLSKINYVECDPRGENANAALCTVKNVERVPMWEFADGTTTIGVSELETLADKTGCELPENF